MDNKEIKKALQAYKYYLHRHNAISDAKDKAQIFSYLTHMVISLIFFLIVGIWAEEMDRIVAAIPTGVIILIILLSLFAVPLILGGAVYAAAKSEALNTTTPILEGTPEFIYSVVSEVRISTGSSKFYWPATIIFCVGTSFIILIASGDWGLAAGCEIGMLAIRAIFFLFQKWCFFSKNKAQWDTFLWEREHLNTLWKQYKDAVEEEARNEEEKARRERAEQKLLQARKAEAEYLTLPNPEKSREQVKRFADLGSPSACAVMGKILYRTLTTETLTKQEKQSIGNQAMSYLSVATDAGITEAEFLLLYIRTEIESHTSKEWFTLLQQARAIKSSNRLGQEYTGTLDKLINDLVRTVDKMEDSAKKRAEEEQAAAASRKPICIFCQNGMCMYYSNDTYKSTCNYRSNPGQCATCLNQKALSFE